MAKTLKIVGPRGFQRAGFFPLQGPLTLCGVRAPPSVKGSGGPDCRGKVEGLVAASVIEQICFMYLEILNTLMLIKASWV